MMSSEKVGYFRSDGGSVFAFDLPLSEVYAEKVTKGELVPVNEDGTPLSDAEAEKVANYGEKVEGGKPVEPAPTAPPDGAPVVTTEEKPKPGDSKAKWVAYAVSQGMPQEEAEGYTRNDLVANYGEKVEGE